MRLEDAGGGKKHGGVAVVPAGVHLARALALEVDVYSFGDGQRVHVSAQCDAGRLARSDVCDDADAAGAEREGDGEGLEHGLDVSGGLVQLELEFGYLVKSAAVGGGPVVERVDL